MTKIEIGTIIADFGSARVVACSDRDARKENNIIVQERDGFGGWKEVGSYNSLSNDYAYTSAREDAARVARRHEGR